MEFSEHKLADLARNLQPDAGLMTLAIFAERSGIAVPVTIWTASGRIRGRMGGWASSTQTLVETLAILDEEMTKTVEPALRVTEQSAPRVIELMQRDSNMDDVLMVSEKDELDRLNGGPIQICLTDVRIDGHGVTDKVASLRVHPQAVTAWTLDE